MAAGVMIELKEPFVCEEPCQHRDCAELREFVGSPCVRCKQAVNSGQAYFNVDKGIVHADCEWKAQEETGRMTEIRDTEGIKYGPIAAGRQPHNIAAFFEPYEVKCDDCKQTIRRTSDVRESYKGGRCDACRTA